MKTLRGRTLVHLLLVLAMVILTVGGIEPCRWRHKTSPRL